MNRQPDTLQSTFVRTRNLTYTNAMNFTGQSQKDGEDAVMPTTLSSAHASAMGFNTTLKRKTQQRRHMTQQMSRMDREPQRSQDTQVDYVTVRRGS